MEVTQERRHEQYQEKHHEKQPRIAPDLTGKRFGRLTVIGPSGRLYYGSPVWRCRCDCGNLVSVWTKYLQNGSAASCPFCQEDEGSKTLPHSDSVSELESDQKSQSRAQTKTGAKTESDLEWLLGTESEIKSEPKAERKPESKTEPKLKSKTESKSKLKAASELKIADYCDRWLSRQKESVHPSTYQRYRYTIENHIRPAFGRYGLSYLTKPQVELFTEQKLETMSVKSVRTTLSILRTLLEYIEEEAPGQVARFRIAYPQETAADEEFLSSKEQARLLRFLTTDMDTCRLGIFLAMMTGMRAGELCALRWKDISFIWRQITVANTLHCVKNQVVGAGAPHCNGNQEMAAGTSHCEGEQASLGKKKKVLTLDPSQRTPDEATIPMTRLTSAYCKRFVPADSECYVLTGARDPMPPWTLHYRFKKYMEECGLPDLRFDDLHRKISKADKDTDFTETELNQILKRNLLLL